MKHPSAGDMSSVHNLGSYWYSLVSPYIFETVIGQILSGSVNPNSHISEIRVILDFTNGFISRHGLNGILDLGGREGIRG